MCTDQRQVLASLSTTNQQLPLIVRSNCSMHMVSPCNSSHSRATFSRGEVAVLLLTAPSLPSAPLLLKVASLFAKSLRAALPLPWPPADLSLPTPAGKLCNTEHCGDKGDVQQGRPTSQRVAHHSSAPGFGGCEFWGL